VRLKGILNPRLDAPLPIWMIFPVIFMALYASHFTLLRVPYYWDEAGYYIPAAWDFFRTGSLIPTTTLSNAHPPLPSIYLALWWKICGYYPEVTREAVLMVASLGLLAVWRLAMRLVGVGSVAFWTVLLTGLYPIWFAQSSLAQADIFAAACSLWGLVYALPSGAVEGNFDHHSSDACRVKHCGGFQAWRHGTRKTVAGSGMVLELHSAFGRLVCVSLRENRISVWQSPVSALQRRSYAHAAAHSGSFRTSHPALDRAHEFVCAGADGLCRTPAQSAA
jgi:hypothetical protein